MLVRKRLLDWQWCWLWWLWSWVLSPSLAHGASSHIALSQVVQSVLVIDSMCSLSATEWGSLLATALPSVAMVNSNIDNSAMRLSRAGVIVWIMRVLNKIVLALSTKFTVFLHYFYACHHARGLMTYNMAVQHPDTGVVSDKGDFRRLSWHHQSRVGPIRDILQNLESVAV